MSVHNKGRGFGHVDRSPFTPTGLGGTGMATPANLRNSSALGAAPLTLQFDESDFVVGYYGQLQIATDSAFTSITQNIVFFIDGNSWARLDESIGLTTPSGTYYSRIRTARDNTAGATTVSGNDPLGNAVSFPADVSLWSNTFTDTINASVNVWNSTTGTNKSQYVAISGSPALTVTGTAGVGATCGVRGTTSTTGKRHFEVKVTTLGGGSPDNVCIGIDDGTTALGPALFALPNPGVLYNNGNIVKNGVNAQTGLPNFVANDVLAVEFDTVAGTVSFFRNGTQVGTTVTGVSQSAYYSYCATQQADVLAGNFGSSAFTMTPTAGYNGW